MLGQVDLLLPGRKWHWFEFLRNDAEAFESSLTVEDWDDLNFVSLKLILYCAYRVPQMARTLTPWKKRPLAGRKCSTIRPIQNAARFPS